MALAALARHGTQRQLARGETLAWAGDEAMVCANLQAGVMKLVAVTAGGEESIVGLLFPGDFIGQPFAGQHGHAIVAATPVQICSFPRAAFAEALASQPQMEALLLERTMGELERTRHWLARMGRATATARVAGFLADVARRMGVLDCSGAPMQTELPLSRGEMAELLGLTIETVSRQISQLKAQGMIETPGSRGLLIRNPAGLAEAASV
ncbi:Crp/Fnr family transcriptional regulator [Polymorphobacter multimanifer]|uniref:CRP/FNR family transcriptional regulator n=1 Tax=Polymorphobacter multimanifer TaxID=1070431 RepID=A0A841L7W0_9SPHN|nr:Crp/Fnr family transcriptional regulator [Polymorphobacter multimanifer]MBB6227043.1 CRP/FNR family transcriptional regulator [Polymorphobacter multimanifer]